MKIPFKRDTASAIAKAREALAAAENKAVSLTAEREALLLAEDGFDRLWSVDKQIAEARAQAQTRRDQIAALEAVQVEEQRQALQKDYEAAVDHVAAMLPRRAKAAADLEAAAKGCRRRASKAARDRAGDLARLAGEPTAAVVVIHGLRPRGAGACERLWRLCGGQSPLGLVLF
jgi:hypothetical protein